MALWGRCESSTNASYMDTAAKNVSLPAHWNGSMFSSLLGPTLRHQCRLSGVHGSPSSAAESSKKKNLFCKNQSVDLLFNGCCCIILGNVFYTLKIMASMILVADVTFKLAVAHTCSLWNDDLSRKEAIQTNLSLYKKNYLSPEYFIGQTSSKGNNCCKALQCDNAFTPLWSKFSPLLFEWFYASTLEGCTQLSLSPDFD